MLLIEHDFPLFMQNIISIYVNVSETDEYFNKNYSYYYSISFNKC